MWSHRWSLKCFFPFHNRETEAQGAPWLTREYTAGRLRAGCPRTLSAGLLDHPWHYSHIGGRGLALMCVWGDCWWMKPKLLSRVLKKGWWHGKISWWSHRSPVTLDFRRSSFETKENLSSPNAETAKAEWQGHMVMCHLATACVLRGLILGTSQSRRQHSQVVGVCRWWSQEFTVVYGGQHWAGCYVAVTVVWVTC